MAACKIDCPSKVLNNISLDEFDKGTKSVASNFKIYSIKTRDCLHLKLAGDFDGTSAHELVNILNEHANYFYEIFIDTTDLKSIHPFGVEVFEKNLGLSKERFKNLVFIGEHGKEISMNSFKNEC